MNTPPALAMLPEMSAWSGTGNKMTPSLVNSYRIAAVAERLTLHLQPGNRCDPFDFFNLCLSLSRGIDYALANAETPPKVNELPMLMKQIYQRKNDDISQAAVMVLMISVKNACKLGWFQMKESEELLTIADEIGKIYCTLGNINIGPSSCHSAISTIMDRFYPKMKLGPVLVSIEAKPGYGASAVDFHITKNKNLPDKIWLLVAQTDNIETSACLISPQQVNFLLNGKGIDTRTNVRMDPGPQMPTNVTGMLKYGTNLLQAVGQFNGHYIILVAYMNVTSLPEHPVVPDYVQPAVTSVDSDSDIIEGASRISLNCPISFTRIKTPVKGRSCKHFQCFDFYNFININFKRPSWRCPHCNQYVCYTDIRLDRNMIEILKNVGKNIVEVIVHADGSWKAVLENDQDVDKIQNKANNCEKEQTEPHESTCSPNTASNVLDLTHEDNHLDVMDTCETADRKPFHASVPSQFVIPNSTLLGANSTGVNQNVAAQIDDNYWTGLYIANSMSDTPTVGFSEHPVLPDTVSHAFNHEAEGYDNIPAVNSAVHNQFPAPNNLQLLNYNNMNSVANEYGRSSSAPAHINRSPIAVQALPVQSQALGPQQISVTNLDSLLTSGSSATPHVPLSTPASAAILSDTERQQLFSRSSLNLPQVSGSSSTPTLQRQSATQNRVPPTQLHNPYRAPSWASEFRNSHLQQALNPLPHQPMQPFNTQRSHIPAGATANSQQTRAMASPQVGRQGNSLAGIVRTATSNSQQARAMASSQVARQGNSQNGIVRTAGATANSQQSRVIAPGLAARQSQSVSFQNQTSVAATSFTADIFRGLTGEQRGPVQSVSRTDELFNSPPDQNWRPATRMRGSLEGRQLTDDIRQRVIAPTLSVQSSSPRPQPVRTSSQLDVLIANNRNAQNNSSRP